MSGACTHNNKHNLKYWAAAAVGAVAVPLFAWYRRLSRSARAAARVAAEKAEYDRLVADAPNRKPPQKWYDEDFDGVARE